jgi:hypothetical protein
LEIVIMDWINVNSAFAAKSQLNCMAASFVCLYLLPL